MSEKNRIGAVVLLLSVATAIGASVLAEDPPLSERQVVIKTSEGSIVMDLYPEAAPNHVAKFLENIRSGFYVGTSFHRAVPLGIVQGGDPLTRDSGNRGQFGTGGLFEIDAEDSPLSHIRGTVAAVRAADDPNSGGSQFFICVTDQQQLDGQYTAFGRVVEGFDVLETISQYPTDDQLMIIARVEVLETTERDRPPPEVLLFSDIPKEELARYEAVIRTNLGQMVIRFYPEVAPDHVRQFLRFSELEIYDGTTFHRVVPGFVIQGGSIRSRRPRLPRDLEKYITPLKAEFSDKLHVRGAVSMARGDDPDSGIDSFFIVLAPSPSLDSKYSIFGEVVQGIEVVDGISQVPVRGESPIVPVTIESISIRKAN